MSEYTKYLSVLILLSTITYVVPQAFATIDADASIFIITVNPASIDFLCMDPAVSDGTIITGNVFDIDDSISFDSIDISTSGLICDGATLNKISTASLLDNTSYNVRLVVSTNDSGDSTFTDSFLQPDSNAAILVFKDVIPGPDPITIQFRDISVINGLEPSIDIPTLFSFESGTLTVTDHNANVDLTSKELITVQINGVDVVLEETDVNTGIFTFTVNAGDSVSYDPGTLGLARATINFEFDVDPEGGTLLVPFALDEKYADFGISPGVFDPFDIIYNDVADDGFVSDGDIRLANANLLPPFVDGSVVDAAAFDPDVAAELFSFVDEKHEDSGLTATVFDVAEAVYLDADFSDDVSIGDVRLANIPIQGYFGGSIIAADAFDGKGDIIVEDIILDASEISTGVDGISPVVHPLSVTFTHGGMVEAGTNMEVTMSYADFAPNDASLLQMYYQNPALAYGLITSLDDVASHDDGSKTIMSNPTFPYGVGQLYNSAYPDDFGLPLPTIQGRYILGFDVGGVGSGSGGITKGGLVLNAVGALKIFGGGSGGGNSPPSFGQSSFAIISGGEEGFGGIINDNDVNTLEQTKTFKVGEKAVIRIDFTEGGGIGKIEHIKLFTNVRDGQKRQDSDASVSYDPLKSPQVTVHDPNGLFSEANFELLQMDVTKFVLKYILTFAKPMPMSDLIVE